jgi:hypothetical protein
MVSPLRETIYRYCAGVVKGYPPPPLSLFPPSLFLYRGATASFIQGFSQPPKPAAARTAKIPREKHTSAPFAAAFISFLLIYNRKPAETPPPAL